MGNLEVVQKGACEWSTTAFNQVYRRSWNNCENLVLKLMDQLTTIDQRDVVENGEAGRVSSRYMLMIPQQVLQFMSVE